MADSSGIPVKILLDAVGTQVHLEVESGESYSGRLKNVEDNMNIQLETVTKTNRQGKTSSLQSVYLRGSSVVFFQLPDALITSPAVVAALAVVVDAKHDARGAGQGFGGGRLGGSTSTAAAGGAKKKRERDE